MSKRIPYWAVTGLFSLAMLGSGLADLAHSPAIMEGLQHLGYPTYFAGILGFWKVAGVLAIVVPGLPRLKEWAYAGFTFALSGAALSHAFLGDPVSAVFTPLVLLALAAASYALQAKTKGSVQPALSS